MAEFHILATIEGEKYPNARRHGFGFDIPENPATTQEIEPEPAETEGLSDGHRLGGEVERPSEASDARAGDIDQLFGVHDRILSANCASDLARGPRLLRRHHLVRRNRVRGRMGDVDLDQLKAGALI